MTEERIHYIDRPYKITIYKRNETPNLYYYFTFNKKSYRGSCKTDNIEIAKTRATEKWFDVKRGKHISKSVRIETIIKKFIEWKKNDSKSPSPNTIYQYELHSKYLKEYFKNKDVNTFTKKDYLSYEIWRRNYYKNHKSKQIQKYKRNGKKIEGRTWKEKIGKPTINREIGLLVSILRYAQDLGYLQGQIVPSWTHTGEKGRTETLSKDEYAKLKQYWTNKNSYYWDIISFVQNTGLRYPSELNNLKWGDVKLSKNYMIIRNRKKKGKVKGEDMSVPIVGTAIEIIKRLKERDNISTRDNDYVFVDNNGKRIMNIRKAFQKSLVDCEIDKKLTMYSLRHTFATRILSTRPDIPLKYVSMAMGHSDTRMIERIYAHLIDDTPIKYFKRSEENRQRILAERNNRETMNE